ncbi:LacI family DNA-binding transcriptional regulator [Devosia epidermidihirudinis]|uniref:LacI family DNA-binding transcriptional regulator n=1 Tax=Devosia epidermidihirudinis TaxID=1293439 RepID=UPI000A71E960|nr:LacI family DNA-binding transcriptional regulator [Devosia epidermidihirudinis]
MARARAVTIKDIAAAAGVSLGTASNALSDRPSVGADLKERVLEAAKQLGYRRNLVAANLRRNTPRTFGLCIPALDNPFFCDIMQNIVSIAERNGFDVLVLETREDGRDEAAKLETLYANRVRGVFMVPTATWSGSHDPETPLIVVDRIRPTEGLPSVALDNVGAVKLAVDYLYDLGHRDIWLVVNSRSIWNTNLRAEGFEAAALGKDGIRARVIEVGLTARETADQLNAELALARPTAILTASGIATLGTLRALQDARLAMPDDISLLGFDDAPWMDVLRPSISVVAQPIEEIAAQAWALMQAQIASEGNGRHVELDARIITRESTGPAPTR